MISLGVQFNKGITELGYMRYIMVPAPDAILIEYFEVDKSQVPPELLNYFN